MTLTLKDPTIKELTLGYKPLAASGCEQIKFDFISKLQGVPNKAFKLLELVIEGIFWDTLYIMTRWVLL